jgi:chloramphenicol 3-O-phosphotransferase
MAIPASNVAPIRPTPSKAGRPARQATPNPRRSRSLRERLAIASGGAIGAIAVGATALSLSDLAESVQAVAHCAPWKAYAMAITLDANFVATEAFSLFASAAVARDTARATATTKVITLVMSAVANSYAMAHTADGLIMQGACIIAGCSVPALIALATYTLGKAARA